MLQDYRSSNFPLVDSRPLGIKEIMTSWGINIHLVVKLDWWKERDLTITTSSPPDIKTIHSILAIRSCLPCQHISARGLFEPKPPPLVQLRYYLQKQKI